MGCFVTFRWTTAQDDFDLFDDLFLAQGVGSSLEVRRLFVQVLQGTFQVLDPPQIFGHQRGIQHHVQSGEEVMGDQSVEKTSRGQIEEGGV